MKKNDLNIKCSWDLCIYNKKYKCTNAEKNKKDILVKNENMLNCKLYSTLKF